MGDRVITKSVIVPISSTSEIEFCCNYPAENTSGYIDSITDALNYVGAFDGIKVDKQ